MQRYDVRHHSAQVICSKIGWHSRTRNAVAEPSASKWVD